MKTMYKSELAQLMGVSSGTMTSYMRSIEHLLPHYHKTQKLLTPDQVQVVKDHFCITWNNPKRTLWHSIVQKLLESDTK